MIFKEHLGVACPVCGDTMTEHSAYSPTWSDHYDDIVCWDCFGKLVKCDSCGCDIAATGFCRVDNETESVKIPVGTCDRCASEWDRAAGAVALGFEFDQVLDITNGEGSIVSVQVLIEEHAEGCMMTVSDLVANEWSENYADIAAAFARLACLVHAIKHDKTFTQDADEFAVRARNFFGGCAE